MAERGGPSLEEIARARASKQVLPDLHQSILITTDSEGFHKDKESLGDRPTQVVYAEDQTPPGLTSSTAMPAASVGSPSITSASGQTADQAQVQTPLRRLTDTPAEAIDALTEQESQSQETLQAGSVVEQGATLAADAVNHGAEYKMATKLAGQSAELGKTVGEKTGGFSSQQPAKGAQEAASESPATAAKEQGEDQDYAYGCGY